MARKRWCADGTVRNWENFGPRSPWGGWVTGGWPRGRTSVPGEVVWWLGWPFGDLDGHAPAIPPVGRGKNARKVTAGAPGQAGRSGQTNPQLRAARGAAPKRALTPIAVHASREPRVTSRVTPASGADIDLRVDRVRSRLAFSFVGQWRIDTEVVSGSVAPLGYCWRGNLPQPQVTKTPRGSLPH